jgi:hypothetical protein
MSKGTQLWPGERMRAFYLAHIRREIALEGDDAERLADALTRATNRILIYDGTQPADAANRLPEASQAARAEDVAAPTIVGKPPFNPYAFSALVVLARSGREGLARRLADIKEIANLKLFAEAQHLAVDPKIRKADDIRKAIVTATEQRLADRKAAAS